MKIRLIQFRDQNGPDAPKTLKLSLTVVYGAFELGCELGVVGKVWLRAFDRALKQLGRRICEHSNASRMNFWVSSRPATGKWVMGG
eukprot:5658971-Pleurochrysis_carterae.AAC.1